MLIKITGLALISLAVFAGYAAWVLVTTPPISPGDIAAAANGTLLLSIAAAALFIGGMMALLRK